jgi:hypothetical protein
MDKPATARRPLPMWFYIAWGVALIIGSAIRLIVGAILHRR